MINLLDYGTLKMKYSYTISDNKIIDFIFLKSESEDEYTTVEISSKEDKYNCRVTYEGNESIFSILNPEEKSLNKLLSIKNSLNNKSDEYNPINIINYFNSTNKQGDSFYTKINDNFSLSTNKTNEIIIDKDYKLYIIEKDLASGNIVNRYHLGKDGVCMEENEYISYIPYADKVFECGCQAIELSKPVDSIIKCIPNLNKNYTRIKFGKEEKELVYDKYGILMSSPDTIAYESYIPEELDEPIFISSLHPFYGDMFDLSIIPSMSMYCIDQIDKGLEEDIMIYTREVYMIDNVNKLSGDIIKGLESKKPIIPIID